MLRSILGLCIALFPLACDKSGQTPPAPVSAAAAAPETGSPEGVPAAAEKKPDETPAAAPAAPASSEKEAYESLIAACTATDAKALWALFSPRFQGQLDKLAADFRQLPAETLKSYYGYEGAVADFGGKQFLAGSITLDDKFENPCWSAAKWEVLTSGEQGGMMVFVIKRPDGLGHAVRVGGADGKFFIDDITKARELPN